ncbi:MAG: hypothetical protein U1F43_34925 [Myxococcota bacterium]
MPARLHLGEVDLHRLRVARHRDVGDAFVGERLGDEVAGALADDLGHLGQDLLGGVAHDLVGRLRLGLVGRRLLAGHGRGGRAADALARLQRGPGDGEVGGQGAVRAGVGARRELLHELAADVLQRDRGGLLVLLDEAGDLVAHDLEQRVRRDEGRAPRVGDLVVGSEELLLGARAHDEAVLGHERRAHLAPDLGVGVEVADVLERVAGGLDGDGVAAVGGLARDDDARAVGRPVDAGDVAGRRHAERRPLAAGAIRGGGAVATRGEDQRLVGGVALADAALRALHRCRGVARVALGQRLGAGVVLPVGEVVELAVGRQLVAVGLEADGLQRGGEVLVPGGVGVVDEGLGAAGAGAGPGQREAVARPARAPAVGALRRELALVLAVQGAEHDRALAADPAREGDLLVAVDLLGRRAAFAAARVGADGLEGVAQRRERGLEIVGLAVGQRRDLLRGEVLDHEVVGAAAVRAPEDARAVGRPARVAVVLRVAGERGGVLAVDVGDPHLARAVGAGVEHDAAAVGADARVVGVDAGRRDDARLHGRRDGERRPGGARGAVGLGARRGVVGRRSGIVERARRGVVGGGSGVVARARPGVGRGRRSGIGGRRRAGSGVGGGDRRRRRGRRRRGLAAGGHGEGEQSGEADRQSPHGSSSERRW